MGLREGPLPRTRRSQRRLAAVARQGHKQRTGSLRIDLCQAQSPQLAAGLRLNRKGQELLEGQPKPRFFGVGDGRDQSTADTPIIMKTGKL